MEILKLATRDEAVRQGWQVFYENCRRFYVNLVEAARATRQLDVPSPERAVNLMLEAIEGVKLRALFESQICSPSGERQLTEDLMSVLRFAGREAETAS
jgi:hypothetical protein